MADRTLPAADNLDTFLQRVAQTTSEVCRMFEQSQDEDSVESGLLRLEIALRNLQRVESEITNRNSYEQLLNRVQALHDILQTESENIQRRNVGIAYQAPEIVTGLSGRLKRDIPKEQIELLLAAEFHVTDISKLLGVSRQTIHNRMREYGLSVTQTYATISNEDLDIKVKAVKGHNRNLGYRWKFVVHGAICGGTRMIPFLRVAGNNKAETVLSAFKDAERECGLPSRIRVDNVGENILIVQYMERTAGRNRGSAIIGRSVHNQRIERLWRDVFREVLCVYYDLFVRMEESGALDTTCRFQMFALHFAFLPLIQCKLDSFRAGYHRHPVCTERSRTPHQMFLTGVLQSWHAPNRGVQNYRGLENPIGSDSEATVQTDRITTNVVVPDVRCPISTEELHRLRERVNPLRDCHDGLGCDVFLSTLEFLNQANNA